MMELLDQLEAENPEDPALAPKVGATSQHHALAQQAAAAAAPTACRRIACTLMLKIAVVCWQMLKVALTAIYFMHIANAC
jgi:hypothetical protein